MDSPQDLPPFDIISYDFMDDNQPMDKPQANTSMEKPKQPLNAYNIFFQYERRRIIAGIDHLPRDITPEVVRQISSDQMNKRGTKRQHRKAHGKISFRELARVIAKRWKNLDDTSRCVLEAQARVEKQVYQEKMTAFKAFECDAAKARMLSCQSHQDEEDRSNSLTTATSYTSSTAADDPTTEHGDVMHLPYDATATNAAALRAAVGQRVHNALVAGSETHQQMRELYQQQQSHASPAFSQDNTSVVPDLSTSCAATSASRYALLSAFSTSVQHDSSFSSEGNTDPLLGSMHSSNNHCNSSMYSTSDSSSGSMYSITNVENQMERLQQYKNHIEAEIAKMFFSEMLTEQTNQGCSNIPTGVIMNHGPHAVAHPQGPEVFTQLIDPSEIERIFEDDTTSAACLP